MEICHHDALANILYKALSQDHLGVLKEQRVSYSDVLCIGDVSNMVALPILMYLCAIFSTQPVYTSSYTSCAGVAAAAEELAKDEKQRI